MATTKVTINPDAVPPMVSAEVNQKMIDKVIYFLDLAEVIYPIFKVKRALINITIEWQVSGKVGHAGVCYRNMNRIGFNVDFIEHQDFWDTTIPHEVAHLVQHHVFPYAKQHHGPEFRAIMSAFGCKTRTYHNMTTPKMVDKKPFVYSCMTCKTKWNVSNCVHKKVTANPKRYICIKCKSNHEKSHFEFIGVRKMDVDNTVKILHISN